MTAITSSAASETERARNLTPGRSGATARITAAPFPSGRWTSSSTTSGRGHGSAGSPRDTDAASPTTSMPASSSLRTPARKIRWSSTRTSRLAASRRDLAAVDGARPRCPRRACCESSASHRYGQPAVDRLRDAAAIGGDAARDRSRAAIAHVDGDFAVADLRRRPTPRPPGWTAAFVTASRAASTRACTRSSSGRVAGLHDLDADLRAAPRHRRARPRAPDANVSPSVPCRSP